MLLIVIKFIQLEYSLILSTSFRIQSFQRKHDVVAVLIVFDSRGMNDSGAGYKHSGRKSEMSEDFTIVVSCPYVSIKL